MVYVNLCGYKWSNPKKFLMAGVTALLTLTGYFAAVLSLLDIMNIIDLKSMWLIIYIYFLLSPSIYIL